MLGGVKRMDVEGKEELSKRGIMEVRWTICANAIVWASGISIDSKALNTPLDTVLVMKLISMLSTRRSCPY